jgi:hypothetical protein
MQSKNDPAIRGAAANRNWYLHGTVIAYRCLPRDITHRVPHASRLV